MGLSIGLFTWWIHEKDQRDSGDIQSGVSGYSLMSSEIKCKKKQNVVVCVYLRVWRGVCHLCTALSRSQQTHSQTCGSLEERMQGCINLVLRTNTSDFSFLKPEYGTGEQPAIFTRKQIIQSM